jgi:hypothetical protein
VITNNGRDYPAILAPEHVVINCSFYLLNDFHYLIEFSLGGDRKLFFFFDSRPMGIIMGTRDEGTNCRAKR